MKHLGIFVHIIRRKYIYITLVFFVWIFVFDRNNLITQIQLAKKLHLLKVDKKYYKDQIVLDEKSTNELLTNPENLEKFARENYLMKRDSEEIFLIIKQDSLSKR